MTQIYMRTATVLHMSIQYLKGLDIEIKSRKEDILLRMTKRWFFPFRSIESARRWSLRSPFSEYGLVDFYCLSDRILAETARNNAALAVQQQKEWMYLDGRTAAILFSSEPTPRVLSRTPYDPTRTAY